jgi:hypothetical protein
VPLNELDTFALSLTSEAVLLIKRCSGMILTPHQGESLAICAADQGTGVEFCRSLLLDELGVRIW